MKTVSIIIPVYNNLLYIEETIQSVLEQTYSYKEIIVIDDGSSNNTPAVVDKFLPRIKMIRQENKGQGAARNAGLRASMGEYIQFLDQDDMLFKEKLERQVDELESHPEVGVVYSKAVHLHHDVDGKVKEETDRFTRMIDGNIFQDLVRSNFIWLQSCLFRRSLLESVGEFEEDRSFIGVDDWDLLIRLARRGVFFKGLDEPLFYYRFHNQNYSRLNPDKMRQGCILVLKKLLSQKTRLSLREKRIVSNALATQRYYYGRLLFEQGFLGRARRELMKGLASFDTLWFVKCLGILSSYFQSDPKRVNHSMDRVEQFLKIMKGRS